MTSAVLLIIPAVVGAVGSIISAYVAGKVRTIAQQTDGRLTELENELRLTRLVLEHAEARRIDEERFG